MKRDATTPRGTEATPSSNRILHVENRRGEFVIFDNQGWDRDWMVFAVYENGSEPLVKRVRRWSNEAYVLYRAAKILVYDQAALSMIGRAA